jgi:hypothetical protein
LTVSLSVARADSAATVTQSVHLVTHGSATSMAEPAPVGTQISSGEYLKTGPASRAEMTLANKTITRLGANTVFNYSPGSNEVDLQAGTVLFSKPKDGQRLNIKTAAVTAAILGTTVFLQVHGDHYVFGVVEGTSHVTIDGVMLTVTAGELVQFSPGGVPHVQAFNVPRFVHSSPLFNNFAGTLPNDKYIQKEIAAYEQLVKEGFIVPGNGDVWDPYIQYPPGYPIQNDDSPGNAHDDFNKPPVQPQQQYYYCPWSQTYNTRGI